MVPAERSPRRIGPGEAVGITEDMIHAVVDGFYAEVRRDPAIGPIFNRVLSEEDWPPHLAKMCDFWSSVLLMTGRFKGAPMAAHAHIEELRATHFSRWLQLFRQAVNALCPPPAAALFVAKAELIAESLQLGVAVSRGEHPNASQRFRGAAPL